MAFIMSWVAEFASSKAFCKPQNVGGNRRNSVTGKCTLGDGRYKIHFRLMAANLSNNHGFRCHPPPTYVIKAVRSLVVYLIRIARFHLHVVVACRHFEFVWICVSVAKWNNLSSSVLEAYSKTCEKKTQNISQFFQWFYSFCTMQMM